MLQFVRSRILQGRRVPESGGGVESRAQIINSVLLAGVVVEDGGHVQNSVLSGGAHLQERASLKDCYVSRAKGGQPTAMAYIIKWSCKSG